MSLVELLARGEEPEGYLDGAPLCPQCLCLTDSAWISPTYRVRNRHHSVTAESGLTLVSQRFVDVVEEAGIEPLGCRFVQLPADPDYYGLVVERMLTVDRSVGKLKFEGTACPLCGGSRHSVGRRNSSTLASMNFGASLEATSSTAVRRVGQPASNRVSTSIWT